MGRPIRSEGAPPPHWGGENHQIPNEQLAEIGSSVWLTMSNPDYPKEIKFGHAERKLIARISGNSVAPTR